MVINVQLAPPPLAEFSVFIGSELIRAGGAGLIKGWGLSLTGRTRRVGAKTARKKGRP
jgi:hypothetical protein